MTKRTEALWRIIAFLWSWTGGTLIAFVVMTIGLIISAVDIVIQLILGSEGINRNGMMMGVVEDTTRWYADIHVFAFTGKGQFTWFPSI